MALKYTVSCTNLNTGEVIEKSIDNYEQACEYTNGLLNGLSLASDTHHKLEFKNNMNQDNILTYLNLRNVIYTEGMVSTTEGNWDDDLIYDYDFNRYDGYKFKAD